MIATDGITDQTIIIPMDTTHGECKSQTNSIKVTLLLVCLGIPVRGSIIITPPANIAETTGTGARGRQRPRPASVILKASRG